MSRLVCTRSRTLHDSVHSRKPITLSVCTGQGKELCVSDGRYGMKEEEDGRNGVKYGSFRSYSEENSLGPNMSLQ